MKKLAILFIMLCTAMVATSCYDDSELVSSVDSNKALITSLTSSLTSLQSQAQSLNSSITTLESAENVSQSDISSLKSSLNTINTSISSLSAQISSLENNTYSKSEMDALLATINNNISAIQSDITALNSNLATIDARLTVLEDAMAKMNALEIVFEDNHFFTSEKTMNVPFTIKGADSDVNAIVFTNGAMTASVSLTGTSNGTLSVTFTDDTLTGSALVIVTSGNNSKMAVADFEPGKLTTSSATRYEIGEEGGNVTVSVTHNMNLVISTSAEWIKQVDTKSTITEDFAFSVDPNEQTVSRTGEILIQSTDGSFSLSFDIVQSQKNILELQEHSLTMVTESTHTLTVNTNMPGNLIWSSSDDSIVKVDQDGTVTAVASGTAEITVTSADGTKSDKCTVKSSSITDLVTVSRTGTGLIISGYVYYTVSFAISNSFSETIHLVSLGGVSIDEDLAAGNTYNISLQSTSSYLQNFKQTLVFTYDGKTYNVMG